MAHSWPSTTMNPKMLHGSNHGSDHAARQLLAATAPYIPAHQVEVQVPAHHSRVSHHPNQWPRVAVAMVACAYFALGLGWRHIEAFLTD